MPAIAISGVLLKSLLDRDELPGVLHGFNSWCSGRQNPVPEFRRLDLDACGIRLEDATLHGAVILSGLRVENLSLQGKTTMDL